MVFVRSVADERGCSRMSGSISNESPEFGLSERKVKWSLLGLGLASALLWLGSRALVSAQFLPHWYCFAGNRAVLWTTVIADLAIGISYVAISVTLARLVRRAGRDLPYTGFFWAFGLFIVSCGATHFLEVVTIWKPVYWLAAATKLMTAGASAATAVVLLVAADDIIDFARAWREAASQRANERFRTLIQAAPMPVISSDLQGRITAWNPAAERLFGWRAEEVMGRLPNLVPPEKEKERAELRDKTAAGEITVGLETTRVNRCGNRFPVSISTAPVLSVNGEADGLVAVIEDI
jgi:PAS domain S-box-containing protein